MMMYRFLPQLQAPCRGLSWLIAVEHMTSKMVAVECNAYQSVATGLLRIVGMGISMHLEFIIILGESLIEKKSDADAHFTTPTQWSTIESYCLPDIGRPGGRGA